jgi:predicted ATPase
MNIVHSGCSSGGKSTLLSALAQRGSACVPEPGRRIVDTADPDDPVLPWHDIALFDAACGFARRGPLPADVALALQTCRYHPTVYLTPPWPQIYQQNTARRHRFAEAVAVYDALCDWLPQWGCRTRDIPRLPVEDRVAWLLQDLQQAGHETRGLS